MTHWLSFAKKEKKMKLNENPAHGFMFDCTDTMYPTMLRVHRQDAEIINREGTVMGYVVSGNVELTTGSFEASVRKHAFFSSPGGVLMSMGSDAMVVTIERYGYKGFALVGQREEKGRMSYIDGCSDSMLVFPNRLGDCVLNHLHFPAGINQTQHTHPSIRAGIVVGGEGEAWYEGASFTDQHGKYHKLKEGWVKPLKPGSVFILEEGEQHSFRTYGNTMDVIAYHPDSDWGPTDESHPMLNRTLINHGK